LQFDGTTPFPGTAALLPVGGAVLIILAGIGGSVGFNRLLERRSMVAIGDLSYSWYLWHWPAIVFAQAIVPDAGTGVVCAAAVVSLVPAWASYRLVETRVRARHDVVGRRALLLAVACMLVPLLACCATVPVSTWHQSPATARLVADYALHADDTKGCDGPEPVDAALVVRCTWPAGAPAKGTVVLVGDSNAGQFTEPMIDASHRDGFDFVALTSNGCAFVDVTWIENAAESNVCRTRVRSVIDELRTLRPRVVVVANTTPGLVSSGARWLEDPDTGAVARTTEEKTAMVGRRLTVTLQGLEQSGAQVILVHTIPHFIQWNPIACGLRTYTDPASCGISVARSDLEHDRAPFVAAETAAADAVPGVETMDLAGLICTPDTCSSTPGNNWLYRDSAHLSIPGSVALTPAFAAAIARAG
jgi:hypothetical protein